MSDLYSFEILVKQNYEKVYRVVYSYTKDKFITEDAVQQAFVIAYKKLNELKEKDKFGSWVTTIALNESKGILKKKSKENVVFLDDYELIPSKDFNEEHIIAKHDNECALKKLKSQESEILILKYYADLSLQQISEILDITLSNTKVRLHRAKESFRRIFHNNDRSVGR